MDITRYHTHSFSIRRLHTHNFPLPLSSSLWRFKIIKLHMKYVSPWPKVQVKQIIVFKVNISHNLHMVPIVLFEIPKTVTIQTLCSHTTTGMAFIQENVWIPIFHIVNNWRCIWPGIVSALCFMERVFYTNWNCYKIGCSFEC